MLNLETSPAKQMIGICVTVTSSFGVLTPKDEWISHGISNDVSHHKAAIPQKPIAVAKVPSIGEQVASLREMSGLSTEQLGKLFGVSRRSVHNWINGHRMAKRHQERLSMLMTEIRSLPGETPDEKRDALFYSVDKPSRYRELVNNVERPVQLQHPSFSPRELLN